MTYIRTLIDHSRAATSVPARVAIWVLIGLVGALVVFAGLLKLIIHVVAFVGKSSEKTRRELPSLLYRADDPRHYDEY